MQCCANNRGRQPCLEEQPHKLLFGVPVSTTIATLSTPTPLAAPEQTVTVQEAYAEASARYTGQLLQELDLVLHETHCSDRDG